MAFEFVPLEAAEQADLIEFLVRSFHADPALTSFRPDVIAWKYFSHNPEWKSARSLAVKQNGKIVAHGGIWPVRLITPETELKGVRLIDWAASRSAIGAGTHLLRKVAGLADVLLAVGGSEDTLKLLPKLGYRTCGELHYYARVIRPWLQMKTTPHKNWKTPVKFLRDSMRVLRGLASPKGWRATRVQSFDRVIGGGAEGSVFSGRTAEGLNRLLACPAARFSGFQISDGEKVRGYFILSQVGRQARIVDLRIDSADQGAQQAACALAMSQAAEDPQTCEIEAASSVETVRRAWLRTGFVLRLREPIFVYDPRRLMKGEVSLDLSLADDDRCFLSNPEYPYLS